MFFSFDGVDGVGKSTQIERFASWLLSLGHSVVTCRDPGSTPLGDRIRSLVLDHHQMPMGRRSEMLLYMAARSQLVDEVIAPALAAGNTVVSDRYLLANVVYQGHAGGLDVEQLWRVGQVATAGVRPQLTFVLDLDVHQAALRRGREPDRMEAQGLAYLQRVREGFLEEARRDPRHIVVIDAAPPAEEVEAQVRQAARRCLEGA